MRALCQPFPSCDQDQSMAQTQATDVIQWSFLGMFSVTRILTTVEALWFFLSWYIGGVGWGGLITFIFLCTQTSCYATVHSLARAHIRHETLLYVLLHVHTYIMLCYCTVLYVFLRVHTYVMLCMFSCTCTHTSCYVMITLLLHLHTHTHTHLMLRCDLFSCTLMPSCNILSCTRTDTGRYVASFFLALSNISHFLCRHLFYIVLLFYCCIFISVVNSRSEWARKVVQGKTANRSLLERHIYIY